MLAPAQVSSGRSSTADWSLLWPPALSIQVAAPGSQIQVSAFQDRSVGIVERVIEFHQLGQLALCCQLQPRDFDVGLTVEVSILAAQRRAVAGTVYPVAAASDHSAGIRIQNREVGRRKAQRIRRRRGPRARQRQSHRERRDRPTLPIPNHALANRHPVWNVNSAGDPCASGRHRQSDDRFHPGRESRRQTHSVAMRSRALRRRHQCERRDDSRHARRHRRRVSHSRVRARRVRDRCARAQRSRSTASTAPLRANAPRLARSAACSTSPPIASSRLCVIVGIAWRDPALYLPALVLVATWYVNITVFLAVGAALEGPSAKLIEYPPGILERTEAIIFFIVLGLLESTPHPAPNRPDAVLRDVGAGNSNRRPTPAIRPAKATTAMKKKAVPQKAAGTGDVLSPPIAARRPHQVPSPNGIARRRLLLVARRYSSLEGRARLPERRGLLH